MFEKVGKRIGLRKDAQVKEKVKVEDRERKSLKKKSSRSKTISIKRRERKQANECDFVKLANEQDEILVEEFSAN